MSYHRNGVSGRGFWTILFRGHNDADALVAGHIFVATFFPKEDGGADEEGTSWVPEEACVAVLRLDDLTEGNAEQAWRGDNFQGELQALVEGYVWKFDRTDGVQYDGSGQERTNRRGAILEQKARKAQDPS